MLQVSGHDVGQYGETLLWRHIRREARCVHVHKEVCTRRLSLVLIMIMTACAIMFSLAERNDHTRPLEISGSVSDWNRLKQ